MAHFFKQRLATDSIVTLFQSSAFDPSNWYGIKVKHSPMLGWEGLPVSLDKSVRGDDEDIDKTKR